MFDVNKSGMVLLIFFFPAGLKILVELYFHLEISIRKRSFDINIACTELWNIHLYFGS